MNGEHWFGWEPLLEPAALAAAGFVALVLLALSWRSSRGPSPRRRLVLLALRALGLSVLGLVLAGPSRIHQEERSVRDPFVVLLDGSRSMRVQDVGGESRSAAVGAWLRDRGVELEELQRRYDLRIFLFGERLLPFGGSPSAARAPAVGSEGMAASAGGGPGSGEPLPADDLETDLSGALFGVTDALNGRRSAGALVVSDGADRGALRRAMEEGEEEGVSTLLSGLRFPVSTWAVGDPEGPADLAIRRVHAPPFGFVRRPLNLKVQLERRGVGEGPVPVTLAVEGEPVDEVLARFDADGAAEVEFEVRPDRIGHHTYSLSVPVPPGDTIPANNTLERTVKVVRDRTRVLQVTSRPSWDVKFLRRLLKTDPNIDLVSFFILRTDARPGPLTAGGGLSLIAFPYEQLFSTDLQGFDLVVFQNFWFGSFTRWPTDHFLENLAEYVRSGGALLMVGGDMSFGAAAYGESPLADVLPGSIPRVRPEEDGFRAALSEAGERHPVTRLARDPEENAQRWASLPALRGRNPLGALREGDLALVTAGADGEPVIAVRAAGKGRSMAVATDTTWQWALGGAQGADSGGEHAELWRNAVRWLVKDVEQKQVQVLTDRENYRLGESVRVQVRALRPDYDALTGAPLRGTVGLLGGGDPRAFEGVTDELGQFTTVVEADREGTLRIDVDVEGIPSPFGRGEARVTVSDRQGELEDPRVRRDLLAAVAAATGGEVLSGDSPDPREATRRKTRNRSAVDRTVEPLWNAPALLLLALLPLGAEWILRRRMGLR